MLLDIFEPTEFWGARKVHAPRQRRREFFRSTPHTTHHTHPQREASLRFGFGVSSFHNVAPCPCQPNCLTLHCPSTAFLIHAPFGRTGSIWLFLDCGLIDRNGSLQSTSLRTLTGTTTRTVSRSHVVEQQRSTNDRSPTFSRSSISGNASFQTVLSSRNITSPPKSLVTATPKRQGSIVDHN